MKAINKYLVNHHIGNKPRGVILNLCDPEKIELYKNFDETKWHKEVNAGSLKYFDNAVCYIRDKYHCTTLDAEQREEIVDAVLELYKIICGSQKTKELKNTYDDCFKNAIDLMSIDTFLHKYLPWRLTYFIEYIADVDANNK